MSETYNEKYHSAKGIIAISDYSQYTDPEEASDRFHDDYLELDSNPDFTALGSFDSIEEANNELQYHGMSLDNITQMNMNRYGNIIDVLKSPITTEPVYIVYIGAR